MIQAATIDNVLKLHGIGRSHREIARITGISRSTVGAILSGEWQRKHAARQADALDVLDGPTVIRQALAERRRTTRGSRYSPLLLHLRFRPTGILWDELRRRFGLEELQPC